MTWRDHIKVHPAADLFPMMSDAELDELAKDIKANSLHNEPVFYDGQLLDGRNRFEAMERAGLDPLEFAEKYTYSLHPDLVPDPYTYVISANIHRRHLTAAQRLELLDKVIAATPEKSDRVIAKETGTARGTVAKRRATSTGSNEPVGKRVGADGKERKVPTPRPAASPKPIEVSPVDPTLTEPHPKGKVWVPCPHCGGTGDPRFATIAAERDAAIVRAEAAEKERDELLEKPAGAPVPVKVQSAQPMSTPVES